MRCNCVAVAAATWLALCCSGANAAGSASSPELFSPTVVPSAVTDSSSDASSSSLSKVLEDEEFASLPVRALEEHEDEHDEGSKPWGVTIGSTLLVNAVTLSGVVSILPVARYFSIGKVGTSGEVSNIMQTFPVSLDITLSAFSAGAILSAAMMLLMPEALHKLHAGYVANKPEGDEHAGHNHRRFLEGDEEEEEHVEEIPVAVVWKWGTCILAGFILSYLLDLFFATYNTAPSDTQELTKAEESHLAIAEVINDDKRSSAENLLAKPTPQAQNRLIRGILIGDFFHNFVDGVFIASAFLLCNDALGWSIVLATVLHEVPQELADFYLLTSYCGLSVKTAIILNWISGMSVMIGGIFILCVDTSDTVLGAILATGGGIYLQIGASEAMPHAARLCRSFSHHLLMLLWFAAGATAVGLVLLDHKHCEEGGEHDGHNH